MAGNEQLSEDDRIGCLELQFHATLYYLYRSVGSPMGSNSAGMFAWYQISLMAPLMAVYAEEAGELGTKRALEEGSIASQANEIENDRVNENRTWRSVLKRILLIIAESL